MILAGTQAGLAPSDGDAAKLVTVTATPTAVVGVMPMLARSMRLGLPMGPQLERDFELRDPTPE